MPKNDYTKTYFDEISNIPLLDREFEDYLVSLLSSDNEQDKQDARNLLIEANLRLVVKISHDFRGCGLSLEDVVANGNIGLVKAAHKFNPEFGTKFSTYAAIWIKQAIKRGISNQSRTIRIPAQFYDKFAKIKKAVGNLTASLGRKPTVDEICEETGYSKRILKNIERFQFKTFSIDEKVSEDSDMEVIELINPEKNDSPSDLMEEREDYKLIHNYMENLTPNEKLVIELRFGLNGNKRASLSDISLKINRTKERVRQIQNSALEKLKRIYDEDHKITSEVKKTKDC